MITANFERALRTFSLRHPFRPFVVELVTGERLQIANPDLIALFGDMIMFMGSQGRYRLFDASSVCQLLDPLP